jgi:hypothetical protein
MKSPLSALSTLASLGVALTCASAYAAGTLSPGAQSTITLPPVPVTVTNTPSVNVSGTVPVTGSVSVTSPVTVQGSVNANITGGSLTATLPSGLTVTNPETSPVFSSNVSEPARVAYQAQQSTACSATSFFFQCVANFTPIPAGKRLVVQNLSWFGVGYPAATSALLVVGAGQGQDRQSIFKFVPFTTYPYFSESVFSLDLNATFYADPGPLSVTIDLYSVTTLEQNYAVNLTGYLVDCAVAACAPIVAQ